MLFEHGIGGANYYGTSSGEVFDLLTGRARLRIFDLDGNGPYARDRFEAAFPELIWNWIARR